MMNDDMALVREYAARQSEQAFETLVSRNLGLVHSAALRQMRDPHLAEEITQTVFIILARKAGSLNPKTILPGWLYRTTRYVSAAALKIQRRREHREQEAHMQAVIQEAQTDPAWEQFSPLLDEAMANLRDKDRDAIVLRYFQNRSLRDVGAVLGVDEYAAQKRVARALEKLHAFFTKRGVRSTAEIIAGAISANSIQTAPALLAKSVTAVAIAKGATASISTLTLIKGALKIMAWTKMKTTAGIGVAVLIAGGVAIVMLSQSGREPEMRPSRPATLDEIRQLFTLATNRPVRCEIEADIEFITPPYTKAQIEAALAGVKNFMQDVNARETPKQLADWEITESNAVVESHSGRRIQHVREWFSGNYRRWDITDDLTGTEYFRKTHPGEYYETYVNIPNSPFSPYAAYTVSPALHSMELYKQEDRFAQPNLWQAWGMSSDVAGVILLPLMEQLRGRTDSGWRLEVAEETLDGQKATRFSFKGSRDKLQADVWVGQISGKTVCLRESTTNFTFHTSAISEREQFDKDGLPTRWTLSTWTRSGVDAIPTPEVKKVVFKRIDLNPTFTDEEAFAPVFPPDYTVEDLSSGHGVKLQNPHPKIPIAK
jgi:RNA polymerase sigma factor (sigma-70 family)